jgi:hypothetical protein
VYNGRIVQDRYFDESLFAENIGGLITTAPSSYAEERTLGQSDSSEIVYTEMIDFDPVIYINDEGLAMFPTILTAAGYSDPIAEDGAVGVFETRSELAGIRFLPNFAKRGAKASICSTSEGSDRKSYFIEQQVLREYTSEDERAPIYYEVGDQDTSIVGVVTYQDQDPSSVIPFIDNYDVSIAAEQYVNDAEIQEVILSGRAGSPFIRNDKRSAAAGWTFLNVSNGTDSIVYSDRM